MSTEYFHDYTSLDIVAIDCSATAIKSVEKRLSKEEKLTKRVKLIETSFTNLPVEDKTVDYIYAQDCIYYGGMKTFQKTIHEIKRVLKPGGVTRFSIKTSNDRAADENNCVGECDYKVCGRGWENDLVLYCPSIEKLTEELKDFANSYIGYLNYDYTGNSGKKSFFVVTLTR